MTKVIINGCSGFMGKVLTDVIADDPAVEAVAGIDVVDRGDRPYPVFTSPEACDVEADVVIDFSNYKAVDGILEFAKGRKMPLVLCTTGLTEEQLQKMRDYSSEVAILRSANMSLGVNLLMKLVQEAARVLANAGFDMEIVEQHHNRKLDAPSGTALALADSINAAMDQAYTYVFDRSQRHEKRDAKEIGISAVRGGSIVGVHDVIYAGTDEVIELRHTAYSRAIFAKGAVAAAKHLAGKPAGMYDTADVIG